MLSACSIKLDVFGLVFTSSLTVFKTKDGAIDIASPIKFETLSSSTTGSRLYLEPFIFIPH